MRPTWTAFGNVQDRARCARTSSCKKFFLPFSGWFLTPKLRYYLYVWSSNASQGDPAQVVGAGNLSYVFNRYVTFGARHHEPARACAAPRASSRTGSAWTIG